MPSPLSTDKLVRPLYFYSPAIKAGPWVRLSGMTAVDPATGKLATGGPGEEASVILANLKAALPDFGVTLGDLVGARIFTTRFDEFPAINKAWEAALDGVSHPPARTSIGVAALPGGATVEIEFEFYREG